MHEDRMKLVEQTFDEIGYRIKSVGFMTWVRPFPHLRKTHGGLLWLPPKLQGFHGELPHLVTVRGVVLDSGPVGAAREFKAGDVVEFQRLYFGHYWKIGLPEDQEYVGWLDANQIMWRVTDDQEG